MIENGSLEAHAGAGRVEDEPLYNADAGADGVSFVPFNIDQWYRVPLPLSQSKEKIRKAL